jgi:hypothetical protein
MAKKYEVLNERFGELTVLSKVDSKNKHSRYKCSCTCGKTVYVSAYDLISKRRISCGCIKQRKTVYDPLRYFLKRMKRRVKESTDIDIHFLWDLYMMQGGKCFYTGIDLVLDENNAYTVSIDRIDSSKGYVKDNIVLTCRNINLFKNVLSANEFMNMLETIREIDKNQIPYYKLQLTQ